jgi:hypothetical protein
VTVAQHPMHSRVVQCESEIREALAELFEHLYGNGFRPRSVALNLNIREIKGRKAATWDIRFDMSLDAEKVEKDS